MGIKFLVKKYATLDYKEKANISAKISIFSNLIISFSKVIMGIFTSSIFLFVSAFYSIGCAISRITYLIGLSNAKNLKDEITYYFRISIILFVTSLTYIIYSIRLFITPTHTSYPMVVGIALAAISTFEMYFAIRGLIKSHKRKDLLLSGLKAISVATALLSIVLTQTAILSFTMPDTDCSLYNALIGIILGGICLLISIFMILRYKRYLNKLKNQN